MHALATLSLSKEAPFSIEWERGWCQNWSGCFGEEKNLLSQLEFES
jgi:hypothetical protein